MKRFIVALGLVLVSLPVSAQPPSGYSDAPEQLVGEWFRRFLGREVSQGAGYWVDLLKQGQPPDAVAAQILASSEYYLRAGNSPQGFVQRLYLDLTGQAPGPREIPFWINQLYASDRQTVAYQMLQRYPQNWNAAYSGGYSSGQPEGASPRDYRRYDPNYDYRRPFSRYIPRDR